LSLILCDNDTLQKYCTKQLEYSNKTVTLDCWIQRSYYGKQYNKTTVVMVTTTPLHCHVMVGGIWTGIFDIAMATFVGAHFTIYQQKMTDYSPL